VFTDGGHPFLWTNEDGVSQLSQTGDVFDVLISDDGQRVVFIRREPSNFVVPAEVRAVNADGSDEIVLITAADFDAMHPLEDIPHNDLWTIAFIPGTHDLLLNTRGLPEGPGLMRYNDLLRLNADSGEMTTVLPAEQGGDFVISPDGSKMAIIRPDSISVMGIDGSTIRDEAINYEPIITYSEFQYTVKPVWHPDNNQMFVAIPSFDPLADNTTGTVWRIPADGAVAERMATFQGSFYFPQLSESSLISPSLQKLVYFVETDGGQTMYLGNLDGSGVTEYETGNPQWMGWSNDGAHFVYRQSDDNLLMVGTPGQEPHLLVTGADLTWVGPDSFVFTQGSIGNWSLYRGWIEIGDPQLIRQPVDDFVAYDWARP
jgi:hypothetical protein